MKVVVASGRFKKDLNRFIIHYGTIFCSLSLFFAGIGKKCYLCKSISGEILPMTARRTGDE